MVLLIIGPIQQASCFMLDERFRFGTGYPASAIHSRRLLRQVPVIFFKLLITNRVGSRISFRECPLKAWTCGKGNSNGLTMAVYWNRLGNRTPLAVPDELILNANWPKPSSLEKFARVRGLRYLYQHWAT